MDLDLTGMLERGVQTAFGGTSSVAADIAGDPSKNAQLLLSTDAANSRGAVRITASAGGVFDLTILEFDVGTALFEYDDPAYMELIVRELILLAAAYLRGDATLEYRRGLFGFEATFDGCCRRS